MKHEQISDSLPWYVAGSLSEAEEREVRAHLGDCEQCRREVEQLRVLQKSEIELSAETPELSPELLSQALDSIEVYERERSGAGEKAQGLWNRVVTAWSMLWTPTPVPVRVLVAAQLLLLVGLTAVYFTSVGGVELRTAGGPEGVAAGVRITIGFDPSASEEAIRGTLQQVEARIVDGPTALGLYVIELPATVTSDAAVDGVIEGLRSQTGVVVYAERRP